MRSQVNEVSQADNSGQRVNGSLRLCLARAPSENLSVSGTERAKAKSNNGSR